MNAKPRQSRTGAERLTFGVKLGFGIGDLGGNLFFTAMGFYALVYLTDTVHLAAGLAGAAILVGKIWDALFPVRRPAAAPGVLVLFHRPGDHRLSLAPVRMGDGGALFAQHRLHDRQHPLRFADARADPRL
jgi:hypothetical protein